MTFSDTGRGPSDTGRGLSDKKGGLSDTGRGLSDTRGSEYAMTDGPSTSSVVSGVPGTVTVTFGALCRKTRGFWESE